MIVQRNTSIRRSVGVLTGAALAGLLVACSPTQGAPSPTAGVSSPTGSASATADPSPGAVVTGSVDPIPEEEFPTEIAGYRFDPGMGTPSYDLGEGTVTDRIVIYQQTYTESARDWFEGVDHDHQELLPGVWCYSVDSSDLCSVNGATGRLWVTEPMIGDMTMEELAAWTQQFAEVIP